MNASVLQGLATAASAVTAIAINSLWEDALLVVCVWLLLRAWPRLNAATRYIVWSATLVATVVVPIVTTLPFLASPSTPAATVATPASVSSRQTSERERTPRHQRTAQESRSSGAVREASPVQTAAVAPRFPERFRMTLPLPVALAILAIWIALAAFAFVRLAIGLYRLEQLKRDALPLPVEYRDAMARWTDARKGSREVRLCVSDDIDVPVAVGLFDAMILIPRALLERLSESEVDQISLHELAHLRRADDWTNGFQRVVLALFAWNPGVLFVGQQLDLEREVACDDWVLASTGLVRPYAVCLAKMAETSSWPRRPMPAPGVFATRKHISLRIERLLGVGRNAATNMSLGPAAATVAIVGALAFAMQLVAPSVAASMQPASEPVRTREVIRYVHVSTEARTQAPSTHADTHTVATPAHSEAHVVATHVAVPSTGVTVPAIDVHVPATNVHVPGQTIAIPRVDVNVGAITKSVASAFGASTAHDVADASSVHACNGCDFAGANWAGRDMRGANLTGSDLSRANLQGTDFSGGTFNGVDFARANLHGASFRNAHLTGCDFTRANLSGVDFTGAILNGCQFTSAELTSSSVRSILNTCTGCDFTHANLGGVDLSHVHVNGVDFTGANLSGANLSDSQFTGVDFSGARLNGVTLTNTVFNACDLGGVDLTHVDLSKAKFIGTDLSSHGNPHV